MTGNVIEFRKRQPGETPPDQLLFTIDIYQGDQNGFSWIIRTADAESQPNVQQLSDYLGDMFFALNPQPPSILERFSAFTQRLNPFRKGRPQ
jgi:hypothetical protein